MVIVSRVSHRQIPPQLAFVGCVARQPLLSNGAAGAIEAVLSHNHVGLKQLRKFLRIARVQGILVVISFGNDNSGAVEPAMTNHQSLLEHAFARIRWGDRLLEHHQTLCHTVGRLKGFHTGYTGQCPQRIVEGISHST